MEVSGHDVSCWLPVQVKVADEGVMADPSSAEIARWMVSAGRHQHASILPWLWEVLSEQDLQAAPGA